MKRSCYSKGRLFSFFLSVDFSGGKKSMKMQLTFISPLIFSHRMIKRQVVDVARLDDLLEEWLPALKNRVGALKMDTEGFEPWVIQGGKTFFSTVRPRFLQIEVSQMSDAATGITSIQMIDTLVKLGYEFSLQPNGDIITPQQSIRLAHAPANVYGVFKESYDVPATCEVIDRLEFDKYAAEYKTMQH